MVVADEVVVYVMACRRSSDGSHNQCNKECLEVFVAMLKLHIFYGIQQNAIPQLGVLEGTGSYGRVSAITGTAVVNGAGGGGVGDSSVYSTGGTGGGGIQHHLKMMLLQ